MFNDIIFKEILPMDMMADTQKFNKVYSQVVNALSENNFTISQTRHLFNSILNQFEREMPVTNHKNN